MLILISFIVLYADQLDLLSFPYTTLFRSALAFAALCGWADLGDERAMKRVRRAVLDRPLELSRAVMLESLRSEEHTSELQSRPHLVCRLLLEKKNFTSLTRLIITTYHLLH